jgi:hypothetical protein
MEVLLIDIGALALFLGYIAIVYWHGATQESRSVARKAKQSDAARARGTRQVVDSKERAHLQPAATCVGASALRAQPACPSVPGCRITVTVARDESVGQEDGSAAAPLPPRGRQAFHMHGKNRCRGRDA